MNMKIATAILLSLAFAPQQRGWVSSVTASGDGTPAGTIQFTVGGNNPCGAVSIDYGDGSTAVTHAITRLPVTFTHEFTRVGEYRVRARGMGNCDGDITSHVSIARVRQQDQGGSREMDTNGDGMISRSEWRGTEQEFDRRDWNNDGRLSGDELRAGATAAIRFGEQDQNRDGVISRAEWRGTAQEFDENDWNTDGRLSGDEVRMGVTVRFGDMDQNGDGIITRNEWRGNAQAFEQRDWNNDGRLSREELRIGATRPVANPGMRFGEMDQNRDGVITRAEWRGNTQAFDMQDWNNDGRLSGDEVREGAQRPYDWTEEQFRRFDRNRDNYLSGTEWRYQPEDFAQVDRNRDDRVSLNEFLNGNSGTTVEMPGGRGRGWGRGNTPAAPQRIVVNNRATWTDTGITVRAGDLLDIDAIGWIRFSPDAFDTAGPDGADELATGRAPLPRMAIGALIGRVGNSAPFLVGENRAGLRAPATGRLFLGINDDNLSDNSGQFVVTVAAGGRGRGR